MEILEAIEHAKEVADEKYKEGFLCYANSGDIENDKKNDECVECAKEHEQLAEWLEELQKYRAIGTVEECREARERQRAKKPNRREDKYTDLIQHYSCPVCGRYFGQAGVHSVILFDKPKYCTCGNAIDWSDSD